MAGASLLELALSRRSWLLGLQRQSWASPSLHKGNWPLHPQCIPPAKDLPHHTQSRPSEEAVACSSFAFSYPSPESTGRDGEGQREPQMAAVIRPREPAPGRERLLLLPAQPAAPWTSQHGCIGGKGRVPVQHWQELPICRHAVPHYLATGRGVKLPTRGHRPYPLRMPRHRHAPTSPIWTTEAGTAWPSPVASARARAAKSRSRKGLSRWHPSRCASTTLQRP